MTDKMLDDLLAESERWRRKHPFLAHVWYPARRRLSDARCNLRWWWQRRTRGYSDNEVWNLDSALLRYLLPRLRALRRNVHGCPVALTSDGVEDGCRRWEAILDEMVDGFAIRLSPDFMARSPAEQERMERASDLLGQWLYELWD